MTIPNSTASTAENAAMIRLPALEEKRIVYDLTRTSFTERESSYFVISKRWFTSWETYVRRVVPGPRPGPISNHDVIDTGRLLVESEDYLLIPQRVWHTLLEWYNGGPPLPRTVIYLSLSDARDDVHVVTNIRLPKDASIWELYVKVCANKDVSLEKALIYDYFNMRKGKLLHPLSNKSLEESGLLMNHNILLEVDGSSSAVDELPLEEPSGSEHSLSTTSLGKGLAGLVNLGNTCYMNSTLQCLAHTPPIVQYLLRDNPLGMSGELAKAFGELVKELWSSGEKAVAPRFFKTELDKATPQFSGYGQHDSHELLLALLARLHQVSDVFKGEEKSTRVCLVCGKIGNVSNVPFTCLSLPLPSTRTCSISLLSCLEAYLAEEPLGPDNMWSCSECKEDRQANKKLDLWKLPEILVFHLQRFRTSKYFFRKIDAFVSFPVNGLDLSKYVENKNGDQSCMYELYAVSNHQGGVDGSGHYTTYAKLVDDDNKWYCFDDSVVSPLNESEVESKAAYILFYRRVGRETATQSSEVSMTDMDYHEVTTS